MFCRTKTRNRLDRVETNSDFLLMFCRTNTTRNRLDRVETNSDFLLMFCRTKTRNRLEGRD